jgi:hypothetical protein
LLRDGDDQAAYEYYLLQIMKRIDLNYWPA